MGLRLVDEVVREDGLEEEDRQGGLEQGEAPAAQVVGEPQQEGNYEGEGLQEDERPYSEGFG